MSDTTRKYHKFSLPIYLLLASGITWLLWIPGLIAEFQKEYIMPNFDTFHILLWYLGPISRLPQLDYLGVTGESQPLTFILAGLALVAIAVFGRIRQLKNG